MDIMIVHFEMMIDNRLNIFVGDYVSGLTPLIPKEDGLSSLIGADVLKYKCKMKGESIEEVPTSRRVIDKTEIFAHLS
jgi:hypothetical protein